MKRVTPAISKGISDNKDTMIDALYPIMGGMISKYVTQATREMVENINHKVEEGLSFSKYKRKLKAKMSGVSETELLLEENADATIASLFIIHKESGLLISEANLDNKEIDDPHMVASMASAIKDFINDWVQGNETQNEVQILSYGNATLYIESAGSVYLIAFLDAEPDHLQRKKINQFFATVVKKYADYFKIFDGDDEDEEVASLSAMMKTYLDKQSKQQKQEISKKNPVKYFLYVIGILCLVYFIHLFTIWYEENSLEQAVLEKTNQVIVLEENDNQLEVYGQVDSIKVIHQIESILKKHTSLPLKNYLLVPLTTIDEALNKERIEEEQSTKMLESKLVLLEQNLINSVGTLENKITGLNEALKITVGEKNILEKERKELEKTVKIKSEIFTRLDKAFSSSPFYNKKDHTLDFRTLKLFDANEVKYNHKAIKKLAQIFEKYMKIIVEYRAYISSITIEGHSDSSGVESDNVALSKQRALTVKKYLEELGTIKQFHMQGMLKTVGYGSSKAIYRAREEDKEASRRIKIKFEVQDNAILKNVKKILND